MSEIFQICEPVADIHRAPRADAMRVTQALYGEKLVALETDAAWVRLRLLRDSYEGWIRSQALARPTHEPTHRLDVIAAHIYPAADIKSGPVMEIYRGAAFAIAGRENNFARLANGGFIHQAQLETPALDVAGIAAQYLGVPYLWGGKTSRGLDCSGLVQIALQAVGKESPRDSGPQCEALGKPLAAHEAPARNDLVFWQGHVGVMASPTRLIHANGLHMAVVEEDLQASIARIGAPLAIKRL